MFESFVVQIIHGQILARLWRFDFKQETQIPKGSAILSIIAREYFMGKAAYLMWDSNMSTFKMYVLILSVKPVILSHFAYEILWVKSQLVLFKHIFCCSQATHPFFGLTTTCFLPNVYWQPGIRKPWLVHWEPHAKSDDLLLNCIRLYPSSQLININIHLGLNLSVQSKILFSLSKPDETYDT
jgi:hypothetical protein